MTKRILVIISVALAFASTASASDEPVVATAAPQSVEVWADFPRLETAAQIVPANNGVTNFNASIAFGLDESIGFDQVKSLMQSGDLFKLYGSYKFLKISDAAYSPMAADGSTSFSFSWQQMRDHFTQSFICNDRSGQKDWIRICKQKTQSSPPLMTDAKIIVHCFGAQNVNVATASGSNRERIQCQLSIMGQTHDTNTFWTQESSAAIAIGFFKQLTSYVAQVGLMAGHNALNPKKTDYYMYNSDYARVMNDLGKQGRALLSKQTPGQIYTIVDGSPSAPEIIPAFVYNLGMPNSDKKLF